MRGSTRITDPRSLQNKTATNETTELRENGPWIFTSTRPRNCSRGSAWPFRTARLPTARSRRPTGRASSAASRWVVKAQIHAGGRGKAGGVKLCNSDHEIQDATERDVRPEARHAPDRPRGQGHLPGLCRGGRPDRPRDLSGLRARPHPAAGDDRRLVEGGMEIEEISAKRAGIHRALDGGAGRRPAGLPGARDRLRARNSRRP